MIIDHTNYWKKRSFKKNMYIYNNIVGRPTLNVIWRFSLRREHVCEQLISLSVSCFSYLSPWARQNFSAPPKIEQTPSHRLEKQNLLELLPIAVARQHNLLEKQACGSIYDLALITCFAYILRQVFAVDV